MTVDREAQRQQQLLKEREQQQQQAPAKAQQDGGGGGLVHLPDSQALKQAAAAAEARLDIKQDHVSFEHLHRLGVVPREALVCEACAMNCFCYASCMPCTMCAMCPADRR